MHLAGREGVSLGRDRLDDFDRHLLRVIESRLPHTEISCDGSRFSVARFCKTNEETVNAEATTNSPPRRTDHPSAAMVGLAGVVFATLILAPSAPFAQQLRSVLPPSGHLNPVVEKLSQGKRVNMCLAPAHPISRARMHGPWPVREISTTCTSTWSATPCGSSKWSICLAFMTDKTGILRRGHAQTHPAVFARFPPMRPMQPLGTSRQSPQAVRHGQDLRANPWSRFLRVGRADRLDRDELTVVGVRPLPAALSRGGRPCGAPVSTAIGCF